IEELVTEAHSRNQSVDAGEVADYIPALAQVDPDLFGIAVVGVEGGTYTAGDAEYQFSIQSISKAFVYALVCDVVGHERMLDRVGVNNTGHAFNSVMAIEMNGGHPMSPMVNAGALATTALAPEASPEAKWAFVHDGLSRFAARELQIDDDVYESESATNQRN